MINNISKNVKESISENQVSFLDKVDPELIRRMTRRELSVIHMGNSYKYEKSALFSAVVKKLSQQSANRKAGHSLILHSGGFASGGTSLASSSIQDDVRKCHINILNNFGVHFGVLGFHDFQLGLPIVRSLVEHSTTTWLCSNLSDPFNGKTVAGTHESVVVDWNGIKVGLMGLVGDWLGLCPRITANDVQYHDVCETARRLCADMRVQGAEFIIAITHCSNAADDELARSVNDIDLIVGGHDEKYRVVASPIDTSGPAVVKSGCNLEDLSSIKVTIQEGDARVAVNWPPLRYSINEADFPGIELDDNVSNILEELGKFFLVVVFYCMFIF